MVCISVLVLSLGVNWQQGQLSNVPCSNVITLCYQTPTFEWYSIWQGL